MTPLVLWSKLKTLFHAIWIEMMHQVKIEVASIMEKMIEFCLRWFGHVWKRA